MSVYRIFQSGRNNLKVQQKIGWLWTTCAEFPLSQQAAAGELIKEYIANDAFRPKVLSIWSEKKPNGDKG